MDITLIRQIKIYLDFLLQSNLTLFKFFLNLRKVLLFLSKSEFKLIVRVRCKECLNRNKTHSLIWKVSYNQHPPPLRLFIMKLMMPLKRCGVAKENYLITLLRNDDRNKLLMSGPWLSVTRLQPFTFTVAWWHCLYFMFLSSMSNFPDEVGND